MILNYKFYLIALITLLAGSFAGCSGGGDDEPIVTPDDKEVMLRLVVSIPKQSASRADKGPDYYEEPEGDFEKIKTLRAIIIKKDANSDGNGKVEANKLVKTYATGEPVNDILEFKVTAGSKRVYLIANEATLPVPVAQSEPGAPKTTTVFLDNYVVGSDFNSAVMQDWTVSLPGIKPDATQSLYSDAKGATGLPLTEFFDFEVVAESDATVPTGTETQKVYLFLTHAAAKASFNVEIADDYKGSGVSITGIRLNGLNWQQWVFPRETVYDPPKQAEITIGSTSQQPAPSQPNRYIKYFTTPVRGNDVTGASVTMNLPEPFAIKHGNKTEGLGLVYFPESIIPVTLAANPHAAFSVQVQLDGNDEWLDAQMLGIGDDNNIQLINGAQAISRNTHLKVTIRFGEKEITARVTVVPYIGVNLDPIFGTE